MASLRLAVAMCGEDLMPQSNIYLVAGNPAEVLWRYRPVLSAIGNRGVAKVLKSIPAAIIVAILRRNLLSGGNQPSKRRSTVAAISDTCEKRIVTVAGIIEMTAGGGLTAVAGVISH